MMTVKYLFSLFVYSSLCWMSGVAVAGYPADPPADIEWPYSSETSVTAIESRFNSARTAEKNAIGIALPMLQLPSQDVWDAMDSGTKMLWLINREREDRGLLPLNGIEQRLTSVAQSYADYLLANDVFGHFADDNSPWERMNSVPVINNCHDFLEIGENLAVLWGGWTLPVERSVYMWMYDDSDSGWGHRHGILWNSFQNNSGLSTDEGFLGVGLTTGTHQGYDNSTLVVVNFFDQCSTWKYSEPGDVNGDGAIDLKDAVSTLRFLSGFEEMVLKQGDTDGNEQIDLVEAVFILRLLAGEGVL